jgi:hypothetical protein
VARPGIFFKLARCGYTLSNITSIIFTWVHYTNTEKITIILLTLAVVTVVNSGFSLCSPTTMESAGQYILSRKSVKVWKRQNNHTLKFMWLNPCKFTILRSFDLPTKFLYSNTTNKMSPMPFYNSNFKQPITFL